MPSATTPSRTPYLRPASLDEALASLAQGGWTPLAGGTDFYPARVGREVTEPVLDLGAMGALRGISEDVLDGRAALRIGALTPWSGLSALPVWAQALSQAGGEIGARQIQNQGTLGGNLCNASPAADGVPPLLALDAVIELAHAGGVRRLPLSSFVTGNRRTARRDDELLTAVLLPQRGPQARSVFLKLGHRHSLVISIAMVAVAADLDARGRITASAAAVGACSPVACSLPALQARLDGLTPQELLRDCEALLDAAALAPLTPIDDLRASAGYRREAARCLLARALGMMAREMLA